MDIFKDLNNNIQKSKSELFNDINKQPVIEKVMLLQGMKKEDEKLEVLYDITIDEILDYIGNMDCLEKINQSLLVKMLNFKYSRSGTETLAGYNYSGVSETFLQDYPPDIKISLKQLKKSFGSTNKARFI